jgi:thioredoxin-like negative regulator of GroEL
MKPARRWVLLATSVAMLSAAGLHFVWRPAPTTPEHLARDIRRALARGDVSNAQTLSTRAVELFARSTVVRIAAAEVDVESGRLDAALANLDQTDDDGTAASLAALEMAAEILPKLGRLSESAERWRRILKVDPSNRKAEIRLSILLLLAGRPEAGERLFEFIKTGKFDELELTFLGDPEQIFDDPEYTRYFIAKPQSDQLMLLAAARNAIHLQEWARAADYFRQLVMDHPGDLDVQAGYGRTLAEIGSAGEFHDWHSRLPLRADEKAEVWIARGIFAKGLNDSGAALRCFWEAVHRDPNQILPLEEVSLLLEGRGDTSLARRFRERAGRLRLLAATFHRIRFGGGQAAQMAKAAKLAGELGRSWEAWAWSRLAADRAGSEVDRTETARLATLMKDNSPRVLDSANPALQVDLSEFPLPDWIPVSDRHKLGETPPTPQIGREAPGSNIQFAEQAAAAGIHFTYFNNDDPNVHGMRIFESNGGGVAVIDYDGDSWPDLYFAQGCTWPPTPGQTRHLDRLYRNMGNQTFADITAEAGLGDDRFSQGVAAGDFDDDGFQDLYVANIGANRLYRNNGDGTVTDWTTAGGIHGKGWTSSCLMADLNGDGFPDIYDVTYLAGQDPLQRICPWERLNDGPRVCPPTVFDAEDDRLYLNRGDGTFEDVSAPAGILAPNGKGLGIVAGDFDGSGRLSLYVANDTTPNFLFINQTQDPTGVPKFIERAISAGAAYDSDGKAHASMGIAVDDADGDGLLDLFVTSFYNEYKILYLQQPEGHFVDTSSAAGLVEPGLKMLAFGTQFLDADLDGWPDLVVANGNIDDFRLAGAPFRMRAQFFHNRSQGRFVELRGPRLGEYFSRDQLGRGLARIDWNRDGREDFVITNLDTPVALLTNTTSDAGHFVALQFRGRKSSRDAVGTKAIVTVGGRTRMRQLTAGDGYESSNQRQLIFGLGKSTSIEELVIQWPSGQTQRFTDVAADVEWLLIEGRDELLRSPPL